MAILDPTIGNTRDRGIWTFHKKIALHPWMILHGLLERYYTEVI
jgi:hypothetical protein